MLVILNHSLAKRMVVPDYIPKSLVGIILYRDIMFFMFGDRQLRQVLVRLHRSLVCEGVRVWRVLLRCQDELDPRGDLYGFVLSALGVNTGV